MRCYLVIDIDECSTDDNCDPNAKCTNTGSFTCTCNQGYSGDGVSCIGEFFLYTKLTQVMVSSILSIIIDDNECSIGTDNCGPNAECSNTPGSFTCTCNQGYSGGGVNYISELYSCIHFY